MRCRIVIFCFKDCWRIIIIVWPSFLGLSEYMCFVEVYISVVAVVIDNYGGYWKLFTYPQSIRVSPPDPLVLRTISLIEPSLYYHWKHILADGSRCS